MVRKINDLKEETGLTMVSFGHAGDGNIHFNIMLDKNNKDELKKAEDAIQRTQDIITDLEGIGADTSHINILLQQAQEAFDNGDFEELEGIHRALELMRAAADYAAGESSSSDR